MTLRHFHPAFDPHFTPAPDSIWGAIRRGYAQVGRLNLACRAYRRLTGLRPNIDRMALRLAFETSPLRAAAKEWLYWLRLEIDRHANHTAPGTRQLGRTLPGGIQTIGL